MPVTIQQATRTVTLLDGLYPLIKLSHITDTWVWLIYTNEGDQLGSMHVKLCPVQSKAIVTFNDSGGFMAFRSMKVMVDIEYARSSAVAASEELQKVKDVFQTISDLVGTEEDDTHYTPDGDVHGGEDDPRPRYVEP